MKVRVEIYTGLSTEGLHDTIDSESTAWIPAMGELMQIVYGTRGIPYQVAQREFLFYPHAKDDEPKLRVQIFLEPQLGYEDGSELIDHSKE